MRRRLSLPFAAALALTPLTASLAAPPPASQPPLSGTLSIQPTTADGEYDPTLAAFVAAVAESFTARGFTVLDGPGHAAYELDLTLGRTEVGTALARIPGQSTPVLAGGIVVPFSTGKSDVVPLQRVRLDLRLKRRGETGTVWHGAAVTVREASQRRDAERSVASDLSRALLQGYPAQPATVVGVP